VKIDLRALLPAALGIVLRRPPSSATLLVDGASAFVADAVAQPPEGPSFAVPVAHVAPSAVVAHPVPLQTSDPLIAREAAGIGIPVVPSLDPLTPEDVAAATEGHVHMASIPGAIADALVEALESPAAQSALESAIAAGEVQLQKIGDQVIANAKGTGALGIVIAAGKGAVEAGFDAELAKLDPKTVAAELIALAQREAKALGG
jgi:hypothetical protein